MLDEFRNLSQHFLEIKNQTFRRYFIQRTPLEQRLSMLMGQRGIGKTTTLIQYLLSQVNNDRFSPDILYIQADHFLMGNTTGNSIKKIKQLLSFISRSAPFIPNWQKLKSIVEIGDDRTLKTYLKYLEDAGLIQATSKATQKIQKTEAPEKIYLNNTNQIHALSFDQHNVGNIRETFFLNMLSMQHDITLPVQGDFLIDDRYLFEIGGKKKGFQQIKQIKNAYLACDDMENGIGTKIPLWLFGFLY